MLGYAYRMNFMRKPQFVTMFSAIPTIVRNTSNYLQKQPKIHLLLGFAILFGLFWVVCFQRLDPDFGWHLRTGDYILSHHAVPHHDLYSYTAPSWPWTDHEWGNDVITTWLYNHGGYSLLATLFAGLWSGALLLAARRARLHVLLLAAIALMPYAGVRPLAWTVLFFSLLLAVLRGDYSRWRLWLPLLFVVWANLHAGFIAGLAVIAYFAFRERRRSTVYLLLVCALATLLNAYGWRLYEEIFRTVGDPALHSQITEWYAFSFRGESWMFVILWAAGSLAFLKKGEWITLSRLLLLSALSASRNLPLFVVSALPELDRFLSRAKAALPHRLDKPRRVALVAFVSTIVVTIYTLTALIVTESLDAPRGSGYPVVAVTYLQQHPCQGNLFNDYSIGGYLIWKLPGQPVYIDGRMPTWRPYMDRYMDIIHHPDRNYPQAFGQHDIHCALLSHGSQLAKALQRDGWQVVQRSDHWLLLEN